jgi:antagonist of KipI
VQVPQDGQPIVLMADRQTTGGYARIATVISADLAALAQSRPGSKVSFRSVPIEEAQDAAVELEKALATLQSGCGT